MERSKYIGGSDIAAVLGVSPYKTPYALWCEKRELIFPDEETPAMKRGRMLEPYVARMYEEERRIELQPSAFVIGAEPWQAGNVDRFAPDRAVEIKTVGPGGFRHWGKEGTIDDVPTWVLAQAMWYCGILKNDYIDIAALLGADDFRIYTLPFDAETFGNMVRQGREFWRKVINGEAPPAMTSDDAALKFPLSQLITAQASEDDARRIESIRNTREAMRAMEQSCDQLLAQVQERMGAAEVLQYKGTTLATWKSQERTAIDVKELRATQPEIAEAYSKTTMHRVFRLK